MSFLERVGFLETEAEEQARLALAPEGSISHALSKLPITLRGCPRDLLIELPWRATDKTTHRVVVVPIDYRPNAQSTGDDETAPTPRRRHAGSWTCAVVYSEHPSYPVGGHRIVVGADELARGTQIDLGQASDYGYGYGFDDGYRAGMQNVITMLAEDTLPPGFDWEVIINGTHAHQDPHDQAGYKRIVGPKIPISPEQASEEAIAELRRRLTAG